MTSRWFVIKIVVCAVAIVGVMLVAPVNEIAERIQHSNWWWLFLAIVLQVFLRFLTALRMLWLARLQSLSLKMIHFLLIVFSSSFYSLFLPGALAGGAITFVKYRQYGASSARSLINILVNKGIAVTSIIVMGVVAWSYEYFEEAPWVLILGGLLCLVAPILMRWSVVVCSWASRVLAGLLNNRLERFAWRLGHLAKRFEALSRLRWSTLTGLFGLALFQHGIAILSMLAYAAAVGISIAPGVLAWVFAVIFLLALLPISFANIGVREASMIFLLAPYGVSAADATAWSLLMYTGPLLSALTGGVLEALVGLPAKSKTALRS